MLSTIISKSHTKCISDQDAVHIIGTSYRYKCYLQYYSTSDTLWFLHKGCEMQVWLDLHMSVRQTSLGMEPKWLSFYQIRFQAFQFPVFQIFVLGLKSPLKGIMSMLLPWFDVFLNDMGCSSWTYRYETVDMNINQK